MIPLFIPFVNRPDLLEKAVRSAYAPNVDVLVINNSGSDSIETSNVTLDTLTPSVPLTFSQTQNWMLKLANKQRDPFYLFMHSDAESVEDSVQKVVNMAYQLTADGRKWSVIFTAYDALAAFSTSAFNHIDGWDTALEWYASDCDMYLRLRLAGYEIIESNLPVKHEPSQTLNADPEIRRKVDLMFPHRQSYYRAKWGGDPGHETYLTPFNR